MDKHKQRIKELKVTHKKAIEELQQKLNLKMMFLQAQIDEPWFISFYKEYTTLSFEYDTVEQLSKLVKYLSPQIESIAFVSHGTTGIKRVKEIKPDSGKVTHMYLPFYVKMEASNASDLEICFYTDIYKVSAKLPLELYRNYLERPKEVDTNREMEYRHATEYQRKNSRFYINTWVLPKVSRMTFMGNHYYFYAANMEEKHVLEEFIFNPPTLSPSS